MASNYPNQKKLSNDQNIKTSENNGWLVSHLVNYLCIDGYLQSENIIKKNVGNNIKKIKNEVFKTIKK